MEMHVAMSGPNLAIAISRASKLPPAEVSMGMWGGGGEGKGVSWAKELALKPTQSPPRSRYPPPDRTLATPTLPPPPLQPPP